MYLLFYKYLYKHFINNKTLLRLQKYNLGLQNFQYSKPAIILGIESSCDDTGCGIIDSNGNILGEAISSQQLIHLSFGGINPTIARIFHLHNITKVCEDALRAANLKLTDIDAIATTVEPGLFLSLRVGTQFGKYLAKIGKKPFIPIHHMQAHALTARINEKIDFPYLILLVSGGHCLLAIVAEVNKFYLLGTSVNNAPGEIFDKIARRLKLRNIPEFYNLCGGLALETAASKASNINQFSFPLPMTKLRNCNFSFAGLLSESTRYIELEERKHGIIADMVIPDVYNFCAAIQLATVRHICHRTQRAMKFIDDMSLLPTDRRTLVVSGGFACNSFLAKALNILCTEFGYNFVRTPPNLCTDNGIMVAWNGVEKWNRDIEVIRDISKIEKITVQTKAPLGEDWTKTVEAANISCKLLNIKKKLYQEV